MAYNNAPGQSNRTVAKQGVDDLVMLPQVSEEKIVENLKKRYENDLIYTYIGPVLIAVNPYKDLRNCGENFVPIYHGHFPHENPPHLYALAEEAYRNMKGEGDNQCILISGESGAGKTESAKFIMGYISMVTGRSEKVEYVKDVVLKSNPLLEAFGNAKTIRNNNSSRFGKYFEIQFDQHGDPCGGKITNYLLEKSRVVYQQAGERNFHFFYNLLAGASQQEANQLSLYDPSYYFYVNQGNSLNVEGINDAASYAEVREAMKVVGISSQEQKDIIQLVAGILHLGNINFVLTKNNACQVSDTNVLQLAASILCVDPATLQNALLFRVIQTGGSGAQSNRGSTYNVPQNSEQALGAKDALAREIYNRLFDFIVEKVNIALQKYKLPFKTVIGILDIYGFEIFSHNGFEQFCINYVNEKLQQYFIELTLKAEQEEYVREGIKWTPIQYFNNQIVCELIEGKVGIFSILDDICYTIHAQSGTGTDLRFLEKLTGNFSSHPHYRGLNGAFLIKHYAGDVTYEVEGFSDKNKDTLFSDLVETLQCSSNKFLVNLFPENTKSAQKKRPTTAGFKIKTSAGALMQALSSCNPHYVRCIKPNDNKRPNDWDHARVQHQCKYLGLLENVRVRRAGFAYRAPFDRFLRRYKKLSKKTWGIWGEWTGPAVQGCETICRDLQLDPNQWQMGKTKIFIRHPETLFFLEEQIERKDFECACKIQNAWKKYKMAKKALEQRAMVADVLRGKKERQRSSVNRQFVGDYMAYEVNYQMQQLIKQYSNQEIVIFADQVVKLNRRNKPERRDFIITDQAFYIICRATQQQQVFYKLTRRTSLADISHLTLSPLADNFLVMHIPKEYDNLIENDKKTEIVAILMEYYIALTGRQLSIQFSDRITYKIKSGDTRELVFTKNEMANQPILTKSGKILKIEVQSGLPKETDSTPQGLYQRAPQVLGSSRGGRGRGGSNRGGGPPPQSSRGGVSSRGGGGVPRGGGVGRGSNRGGGPPPQSSRGGVSSRGGGGVPRGAPPRGGKVSRGAPPRGGGAPRGGGRGGIPSVPQPKTSSYYIALYSHEAQSADELSFKQDEIIEITKKSDSGWWEGEKNGKKGFVPANYLKEYQQ